jgi:ElaB/YqjD/DUF883 family membrane-anchored ribosome-binding protein
MKSTTSAHPANNEKLPTTPVPATASARKSTRHKKQADTSKDEAQVSRSEKIATLTDKLTKIEKEVVLKTKAIAQTTNNYVHASPWQAMVVAAGTGFLISHFLAAPKRPK